MHESRSTYAAAFSGTVGAVMPRTPSLELSVLPSGGGQSSQRELHDLSIHVTLANRSRERVIVTIRANESG